MSDTLPLLRQDLQLIETDEHHVGKSVWALYDRSANKFFRLQWKEIEILRCLSKSRNKDYNIDDLVFDLQSEDLLLIEKQEVIDFIEFLDEQNLLLINGMEKRQKVLSDIVQPTPLYKLFLKHYLFFKIPLLKPDQFLYSLAKRMRWFFTVKTVWALCILSVLGIFITGRHWHEFTSSVSGLLTPQGLIAFFLALSIVKVLHEFGHALAAKTMGCSVHSMGIAFMIFWPILYTDTTDTWRLPKRTQRIWVGVAGIMVELAIAVLCLFLWHILPAGNLRNICFLLATITWAMTLLVNLNPLMRFDGYFVFSDIWRVENLQERSFALGRWWIRRTFFGFCDEPPEAEKKLLIIYCFSAWLYRLFLVMTIGYLIYAMFFKLLAIILVCTYIVTSLLKPIMKELIYFMKNRKEAKEKSRQRATLLGMVGIILILFLPWSRTIDAPALLETDTLIPFYANADGKIKKIPYSGQVVSKKDIIFSLDSPDLLYEADILKNEYQALQWRLENHSVSNRRLDSLRSIQNELASVLQKQNALSVMQKRNQIIAEENGVIYDIPHQLRVGSWVAKGTHIGNLVVKSGARITAYIDEQALDLISKGAEGMFIAEGGNTNKTKGTVEKIESTAVKSLTKPYLASSYGGELTTANTKQSGPIELLNAYYRVHLSTNNRSPSRVLRGVVKIEARDQSIMVKMKNRLLGVFRREAGF